MEIYQIVLGQEIVNAINKAGREKAIQIFPQYEVYLNCLCEGSEGFKSGDFKFFEKVADVDSDSMDDTFRILNLWDEEERVTLTPGRAGMKSLSVGDIVSQAGRFFMVEDCGFKEIVVEAV